MRLKLFYTVGPLEPQLIEPPTKDESGWVSKFSVSQLPEEPLNPLQLEVSIAHDFRDVCC